MGFFPRFLIAWAISFVVLMALMIGIDAFSSFMMNMPVRFWNALGWWGIPLPFSMLVGFTYAVCVWVQDIEVDEYDEDEYIEL